MNLELLDPFQQEFPEVIEDTLDDGYATVCRFNRRGTLLATGGSDGRVVVFDFVTRGIARTLIGHVRTVSAISWSVDGRHVLSASADWNCMLWDLIDGSRTAVLRFASPVLAAHMHPRKALVFVAVPLGDDPVQVTVNSDKSITKTPIQLNDLDVAAGHVTVARYDRKGTRILLGTSKGMLLILDAESHQLLCSLRVANTPLTRFELNRRGDQMLINSTDKILRLFSLPTTGSNPPNLLHKFQDLVNRIQWSSCGFSCNGEYIIGGTGREHNIYIWEPNKGSLVKMLEGPREGLDDLVWHPYRPIIASVSSYGIIYIWAASYQENWSAFAPEFQELEENVEYVEREDEFDVVPNDELDQRKNETETVDIDIITVDRINPFGDSDSEAAVDDDDGFRIPVRPELESGDEQDHNDDDDDEDEVHVKARTVKQKRKKKEDQPAVPKSSSMSMETDENATILSV